MIYLSTIEIQNKPESIVYLCVVCIMLRGRALQKMVK